MHLFRLVSIFGSVMAGNDRTENFLFSFLENNIVGGALNNSEWQRAYGLAPMLEIAFCLPHFGENKWVTALHRLKCFFLRFFFVF